MPLQTLRRAPCSALFATHADVRTMGTARPDVSGEPFDALHFADRREHLISSPAFVVVAQLGSPGALSSLRWQNDVRLTGAGFLFDDYSVEKRLFRVHFFAGRASRLRSIASRRSCRPVRLTSCV